MNDDARNPPTPAPTVSSAWWVAFRDSLKEGISPYRAPFSSETSVGKSTEAVLAPTLYGRLLQMINGSMIGKGGDPDKDITKFSGPQAADKYMSQCIVKQYKAMATPFGEFTVQCTEGTVRGQAEESRNAALSASFRLKHRTSAQKYGDFYEMRRQAIIGAHGCTYEESLLGRFPVSARAYVTSSSEARLNCVRYSAGSSSAEAYMASCVDKQMKYRAAPTGVYDVMCTEGNAKGVAEFKRVSSLSAKFRAKQMSPIAKEQAKFNNAAYARTFFAHDCSYEEALFNKYPAVSASMRPSTARY